VGTVVNNSEVHSLIIDRVEEVEDDDMRSFLREILQHERDIVQEPRAEYAEQYKDSVDNYVGNRSLEEYSDG
jgi:rRNA maturation endonuclease Nob1